MGAEDLKEWLRGAEAEKKAQRKSEVGYLQRLGIGGGSWGSCASTSGLREKPHSGCCLLLLSLFPGAQAVTTYQGIGLFKVIWKFPERVLDAPLLEIDLHDLRLSPWLSGQERPRDRHHRG